MIRLLILVGLLLLSSCMGPSGSERSGGGRIPLILDTDVCDDIDDIWTVGFVLQCPEFDVKLITVSVNDTTAKAKVIARMLEDIGRTDVPIGVGVAKKTGHVQDWAYRTWADDYDLAEYPGTVHEDGAQAIVDVIKGSREPVAVLSVGPVPTVATAVRLDPTIAENATWWAMSGSIYKGYEDEVSREYNAAIFPKDSRTVYYANWQRRVIAPLDVAVFSLKRERYQRVRRHESALVDVIMEHYRNCLTDLFHRRDPNRTAAKVAEMVYNDVDSPEKGHSSPLFDTVPVYMLLRDDALKVETHPLIITKNGYTRIDPEGVPVDIALEWVDQDRFMDFLVERLVR